MSEARVPERKGVMLIKGLSRAGFEMRLFGRHLRAEGFETAIGHYASRELTIDEATATLTRQCADRGWDVVHTVGHSLGGVIASKMIADRPPPPGARWGRAVQLGAPNEGTAVADWLSGIGVMRRFLGPTIEEMSGPREDLIAASAHDHVGAIVANTGQSPMGLASGMEAPNDGKVPVSSAFGEAPNRLLIDIGHAFYPYSKDAMRATTAFLRDGRFPKGAGEVVA